MNIVSKNQRNYIIYLIILELYNQKFNFIYKYVEEL